MPAVAMEMVVMVAIGVLGTIFVASLIALVFVCRHKYCRSHDLLSKQLAENRSDAQLVENMEGPAESPTGVELDDVGLNTNLEQILQDYTWVSDATGLAPHCLAILKICHMLTEKLVGMTMGNAQQLRSPENLNEIVAVAKRISPRVDEVVTAMYPPLDPRLLEARCSALVLSVSHLVMVAKGSCRLSGVMDWVDQSLADVEDHIKVLHEASVNYEAQLKLAETLQLQQQQQQQPQQPGSGSPSHPNCQPSQGSPNVVQLQYSDASTV